MAVQRFYVEKRWSDMAVHNGTVYLAGQTPDDRSPAARPATGST